MNWVVGVERVEGGKEKVVEMIEEKRNRKVKLIWVGD